MKLIEDAINRSQHCQRNWDLTKTVPQKDIELIVKSAIDCPVKQNFNYYKVHVITDRGIINEIHNNTEGFWIGGKTLTTNPQSLANVVLAFLDDAHVNDIDKELTPDSKEIYEQDKLMSIGIASGYAAYTANLLGYSTGFCKCLQHLQIKNILGSMPNVLLGVGFPDKSKNRQEHHLHKNLLFPSFKNLRKQATWNNTN